MNENRIVPELLTVKATAKRFSVSERYVRAKAQEGAFPAIKSGNRLYINADKFSDYLNTATVVSIPVASLPKSKAKSKEEDEVVLGIRPIRK